MKDVGFTSPLAGRMSAFIALRRLSGTKYATQTTILRSFDRFLARRGDKPRYVTREIQAIEDAFVRSGAKKRGLISHIKVSVRRTPFLLRGFSASDLQETRY